MILKKSAVRVALTFTLVLFLLNISTGRVQAQTTVKYYLQKYSKARVTTSQLERLAYHEHLIEYFCSFSFFEPNHKVNPNFIKALILAESAATSTALSHKGARGLTQIIGETGKIAARELARRNMSFRYVSRSDLENFTADKLYDPAVNILLACFLIAKYNYNYEGRLDLVVSAWNAGEGSIVDNAPPSYQETMDLIGKVNGYYLSLLRHQQVAAKYASRR